MIVGSRALAYWHKNFKCRDEADWDVVGSDKGSIPGRVEFHDPNFLNNYKIPRLFKSGEYLHGVEVCSPWGLRFIKRSHLWREKDFDKHITLYHKYIIPVCEETYVDSWSLEGYMFQTERARLTKEAFPQRAPSLNKSNDDFFDDAVEKLYDHDYLHELFAFYDRPLFEKLKHDGKEDSAWCSRDLWDKLPTEDKTKCVAEETYVIAAERFLIPTDWQFPEKLAYFKALRKVCTTLCSGWFRDWALDNYPQVVDLYNKDHFTRVKDKLNGKN